MSDPIRDALERFELENKFWEWCEQNTVNGAMRIDEQWRVDEVATAFSSYYTQPLRDALALCLERLEAYPQQGLDKWRNAVDAANKALGN